MKKWPIYFLGISSAILLMPLKAQASEGNPGKTVELKDWTGHWKSSQGGYIDISVSKGNLLRVVGDSAWNGGKNQHGDEVVHEGTIDAVSMPKAADMHVIETEDHSYVTHTDYEDVTCIIDLRLMDNHLIAHDNKHCGGVNVSFDGIYQKAASVAPAGTE